MSAIFGSVARRLPPRPATLPHRPIADPPNAGTICTSSVIASANDAHLIAILDAPLATGEPAHVGFRRKETELGNALGALPIADQRALHARLSNPHPGDTLAHKFYRLTIERRARLLDFLSNARRREALAASRR